MIKKMILPGCLGVHLGDDGAGATVAYPQLPVPPCYPCDGGGN